MVERAHAWFNHFRKLLVSFEKTEASYIASVPRRGFDLLETNCPYLRISS